MMSFLKVGNLTRILTETASLVLGYVVGTIMNVKGQSDTIIAGTGLAVTLLPLPPIVRKAGLGIFLSSDFVGDLVRDSVEKYMEMENKAVEPAE